MTLIHIMDYNYVSSKWWEWKNFKLYKDCNTIVGNYYEFYKIYASDYIISGFFWRKWVHVVTHNFAFYVDGDNPLLKKN